MSRNECIEALSRLYDYLDGELPPADAESVRHHMEVCQGCYPVLRFSTAFQDALHKAARGQRPCPQQLRKRIAELLHAEGPPPT